MSFKVTNALFSKEHLISPCEIFSGQMVLDLTKTAFAFSRDFSVSGHVCDLNTGDSPGMERLSASFSVAQTKTLTLKMTCPREGTYKMSPCNFKFFGSFIMLY